MLQFLHQLFTFLNNLQAQHASSHAVLSGNVKETSQKYTPLDGAIMMCSPHLDHLPVLAGYLGVPDRCLEQIQNDYSLKMIQGYWVLKKYKELNPEASLTHLIEVLKLLGLEEAVERYNYDTMHNSNDNMIIMHF